MRLLFFAHSSASGVKLLFELRKIEEYSIFGKTIGVAFSSAPTKGAGFAPRLPSPLEEGGR